VRLKPSRTAACGIERVSRYVEFWGIYLPLIHGVASALIAARDTHAAAAEAWNERAAALQEDCAAAVDQLVAENSAGAAH
jgi:hypothetical protein